MKYTFGAKVKEKHPTTHKLVEVWKNPKYEEGYKKAVELIDSKKYGLSEADFWILKTFGDDYCQYAGLIISHNGCLKVNDTLDKAQKFVPSCVSWVRNVAGDLVLQYLNDGQGLLEFGEASGKNCKNAYPFAMVLKRLQDRVILKNSKIAFSGIMSEVESDEFKEPEKTRKECIVDAQSEESEGPTIELPLTAEDMEKIDNCKTGKELINVCQGIKKAHGENEPKYRKALLKAYNDKKATL